MFGSFGQAGFLTFDKTKANLYVTDWGNDQIDVLDYASGQLTKTISLNEAYGVAIDRPAKP